MNSKFPGKCACGCETAFPAGEEIDYVRGLGALLPGHRPEEPEGPRPGDEELAERLGFRRDER